MLHARGYFSFAWLPTLSVSQIGATKHKQSATKGLQTGRISKLKRDAKTSLQMFATYT